MPMTTRNGLRRSPRRKVTLKTKGRRDTARQVAKALKGNKVEKTAEKTNTPKKESLNENMSKNRFGSEAVDQSPDAGVTTSVAINETTTPDAGKTTPAPMEKTTEQNNEQSQPLPENMSKNRSDATTDETTATTPAAEQNNEEDQPMIEPTDETTTEQTDEQTDKDVPKRTVEGVKPDPTADDERPKKKAKVSKLDETLNKLNSKFDFKNSAYAKGMEKLAEAEQKALQKMEKYRKEYRKNIEKIQETRKHLIAHKRNTDLKPLKEDYAGVLRCGDDLFCVSELPNPTMFKIFLHPNSIKIAANGEIFNDMKFIKKHFEKGKKICETIKVLKESKDEDIDPIKLGTKAYDKYINSESLTVHSCTECIVVDNTIYVSNKDLTAEQINAFVESKGHDGYLNIRSDATITRKTSTRSKKKATRKKATTQSLVPFPFSHASIEFLDTYDRNDNDDNEDADFCLRLLEEDKWKKKKQQDCIRKSLAYAYEHGLIEDDPSEYNRVERINTIKDLLTLKEGELDIATFGLTFLDQGIKGSLKTKDEIDTLTDSQKSKERRKWNADNMNKIVGNILEAVGIMNGLSWTRDRYYDSFTQKVQSYVAKAKAYENQTYLKRLAIAIKLSLSFKNYYSGKVGLKKGWKNNKKLEETLKYAITEKAKAAKNGCDDYDQYSHLKPFIKSEDEYTELAAKPQQTEQPQDEQPQDGPSEFGFPMTNEEMERMIEDDNMMTREVSNMMTREASESI